ncbi:Alpha-maltose-1-phosphate synthase [Acaryochloris thomasi RCC1774]|uniref:Alpha-maltose-1-phosphate synthase n=1 Tax=Acaryochloris thomasi RCC1774 TaxID=1764569 RepID=A0A2W1JG52_9CYAN|nr:glycosyltransferase family 4 protein [Acaryochloris thomasi]PZD72396.1 Alpha-maltose-1-phosphate synthase [Acaryochloris thomasi RCC1774]
MRVLHINQTDIEGGAAIAAYRLHEGLLENTVDSQLLVDICKSQNKLVSTISRKRAIDALVSRVFSGFGLNYLHILSSFNIKHQKSYQEADIVNLHNIHGDYFNYLALPHLTQQKPTVWTLHDMWSFTGHCAYSFDCNRWQIGCGQCPYPETYPQIGKDASHLEWRLKDWLYSHSNLDIVVPSSWLYKLTQASLLNKFPIHHIPNGINTSSYYPLDPQQCRAILGIPSNRRVLMFAADRLSDLRKGIDLLYRSLAQLSPSLKQEIILLTLGAGEVTPADDLGIQHISLGYTGSDRFKAIAYSAADLFLFPTRADNLPLTLQESMACGTPIISFDIGGVPDLVRPGKTGFLAKPEDSHDFAQGIIELLEDDALRASFGKKCRSIACEEYSLSLQAQRYIKIYEKIRKNAAYK